MIPIKNKKENKNLKKIPKIPKNPEKIPKIPKNPEKIPKIPKNPKKSRKIVLFPCPMGHTTWIDRKSQRKSDREWPSDANR
jgi:hypothetical protein